LRPASAVSSADFAWTWGSLCQLHRVPFDGALLLQRFPPPYDRTALLGAGGALDFKIGERKISGKDLVSLPLPCLAFLKEEDSTKTALIVKAADKGFLYFEAGSNTPHQLALDQFDTQFDSNVLLVGKAPSEARDRDLPVARQEFGFRWFIPELLKLVAGAAVTLLLDCPFLVIFLAVMFWYGWQLTLIVMAILALIIGLSVGVTPISRAKLNKQFLVAARNTAFVTEYVSGMATVKSLQMEPVLEQRYGELLAKYLAASFATKQLANTYNSVANLLGQTMTLAILVVGALIVMESADGALGATTFTIGMLVASRPTSP
jgi:ABC-type bacteriocin/lantibiotic exporter with double-glycine peptidase domain